MKKFFILLIVFVILSNCEISPKKTIAQNAYKLDSYQIGYREINGMKYAIFSPGSTDYQTGVFVVNLTKDALEVEMLKLQIQNLKK